MARIHYYHALLGGEPQPAVACPATGRLGRRCRRLAGLHAVFDSKACGLDHRNPPVGEIVENLAGSAVDAPAGRDPEVAVIVRQDPRRIVVKESDLFGVSRHAAIADGEPRETRNPAAEPEVAAPVIENRSDREIDLLLPGLDRKSTRLN